MRKEVKKSTQPVGCVLFLTFYFTAYLDFTAIEMVCDEAVNVG